MVEVILHGTVMIDAILHATVMNGVILHATVSPEPAALASHRDGDRPALAPTSNVM